MKRTGESWPAKQTPTVFVHRQVLYVLYPVALQSRRRFIALTPYHAATLPVVYG
jgi:hypothetical protein